MEKLLAYGLPVLFLGGIFTYFKCKKINEGYTNKRPILDIKDPYPYVRI